MRRLCYFGWYHTYYQKNKLGYMDKEGYTIALLTQLELKFGNVSSDVVEQVKRLYAAVMLC